LKASVDQQANELQVARHNAQADKERIGQLSQLIGKLEEDLASSSLRDSGEREMVSVL